MTIYALWLEYEQTAADLYHRISELERAGRETEDAALKRALKARVRPLRYMYRDVRAAARHLENYYDKSAPKRSAKTRGRERRC